MPCLPQDLFNSFSIWAVLCLAVGNWDLKSGIAAGERDNFLKYLDQFFDNLLGKPYTNGRTQIFVIIDMDNYSFSQFTTYGGKSGWPGRKCP